jgi:hypothetical protein
MFVRDGECGLGRENALTDRKRFSEGSQCERARFWSVDELPPDNTMNRHVRGPNWTFRDSYMPEHVGGCGIRDGRHSVRRDLPGTIATPSLTQRVCDTGDHSGASAVFVAPQPMGWLGTAEEVAALAALSLAMNPRSPRARFMSLIMALEQVGVFDLNAALQIERQQAG